VEIGITAALPLEQFFPSDPLTVASVANLQPACVMLQIGIKLPLGDDPFEVLPTGKLEKSLSKVLNMIAVEESITRRRDERSQSLLAVDQW
jgi:hypothetical protein